MPSVGSSQAADDDMVLTGLSGRLPESSNIEEFTQHLFEGVDLVSADNCRWTPGFYGLPERSGKLKDLAHFDAAFFGVHAKQAHVMDPQLRLLLEVTYETIVDAGLSPAELRGSRTGVYVGLTRSESFDAWCRQVGEINGYSVTGCNNSMMSNRISYAFDLNGPSMSIDTACSSSTYALAQAVNDIRAGRCDAAVVAGTNLCLDPASSLNYHRLTMLSSDGRCAAFDESGGGYVRSEAVVAVLVQRRQDARRVYCTVRGVCTNNDGYKKQGITYPAGTMQKRNAQDTYEEAHLLPQDVVYVEAHGTGTKVGDPEEVNAIAELFCTDRQTPLLLGSVKSNMGHAEPASGICSIVKVVKAMERGVIPGNLHFTSPNKNIPAFSDGRIKVVDKNTPWQGGLVAINSFGFGGANAHLILEGGRGTRPPPARYPVPRLVLASGRTHEAVERLLHLAADHPQDSELHAMIDAVHIRAIFGHPYRGYTLLDPAAPKMFEIIESGESLRPVWFVFSGMGSQWAGMARKLLSLPIFAASIAQSATALEPYGVDLQYVITEAPDHAFDNVIDSAVAVVAVQVALVDVLRELGVRPDGIIGHSIGELGCGYADETLTREQAVLCAYWRGRSIRDANLAPGAMAAVGLSWEEATRRCPADIVPACHNSVDNVTIAGPPDSIEKFVAELSAEGIFARHVNSSGIAFHSKYVAAAGQQSLASLEQLIPKPKSRSGRWLSSSIPEDQWDADLAKLSDGAYFVNNLLSPVRFAGVLRRVPARALVVEVAPHAILQAVLRRALPAAAHAPLVRREAPDALIHLLAAIGKIYVNGAQPQVSRLYPTVSWPVSRGTPALASHIVWDHSMEWSVADFTVTGGTGENIIEYDLSKAKEAFIAGHNIDGRILFPATGYLMLVWRTLAKMHMRDLEQTAVVLENVHFRRATILTGDAPLRFLISILGGTGEFEVCENGEVVFTGTARVTADPTAERLPVAMLDENNGNEDNLTSLNSEDIYKELRLRGYYYQGVFRGIKSSDGCRSCGLLDWQDNWITFMDTMLQFLIIGVDTRELYLPTRIQRVLIDPVAQRAAVATTMSFDGIVPIKCCHSLEVVVAGGIEFRGVKTSLAPRRANAQAAPKLEKCIFMKLEGARVGNEDDEHAIRQTLTAMLQLAVENCNVHNLKLTEPAFQHSVEALMLPQAVQALEAEPGIRVTATLAAGADAPRYIASMDAHRVKVSNEDAVNGGLASDSHVVLGSDVLSRRDGASILSALVAATDAFGFVLLDEPAHTLGEPVWALLASVGLTLMSTALTGSRVYLLLRRATPIPRTREVLEIRQDDYAWVERLKGAMKRAETEDMRVYIWSNAFDSGVQGLAKCLRREPGGNRLRAYYLPGKHDTFDPDAPVYKTQVQLDLAFNVQCDGVWGTFRHLLLDITAAVRRQVNHAYVNTLSRGDLSSLDWIESDVQHAIAALPRPSTALCHVYYAPLNFRDVMLATGKLPPNALPGALVEEECILGLEFSGRSSTGKRVMGIVAAKGLATTVLADEAFMWDVPKKWSLEEAATVPVAYATAYYALCVRGRMRRGETVLVHTGAGGVGQAAIAIALHAGCSVFTTVGTADKRAFLRERFPQLPDANIGNSRDCSFEQLVRQRTCGRGVDLLLNCLAGDKLQASVRCLGQGGRFLEIGKFDLSANTALGLAVLLKNTTVHGVLLDALFDAPNEDPEKMEVARCLTEGIAAGVVRPLPTTVFADKQLEQAFRYMATGKHIGKVLIRVREEDASGKAIPAQILTAIPRIYMHPDRSYVLVGGLGGIGLELGEWLVRRGARTLVFSSRNGLRTGYQAWCIRRWRAAGVKVHLSRSDATTAPGARALLQEAAVAAPIGGIFNLAAELRDAFLENQTQDAFRAVVKPKIDATRALDIASRELAPLLEYFVAFSSVSCGWGNAGQSNYGLANSGMERLCERRRADGLPALAVQWGAVGDVGLAAAMHAGEDADVGGTVPQCIASCLHTLEKLLLLKQTVVSSMVVTDTRLRAEKPEQDLLQTIASIIGINDPKKVSETTPLAELGMDSLMSAEIKQILERRYDMLLDVNEIRALTIGKLRDLADIGHAPVRTNMNGDCENPRRGNIL